MMHFKKNKVAISGLLTALPASLCCITPLMAILAGSASVASNFSWIEAFRPFLILLTIGILGFAWYQQLAPKPEMECECEEEKPSFLQSKFFLSIITLCACLMLAFPYYADSMISESNPQNNSIVFGATKTYTVNINGMTCTGCEVHVKSELAKVPGIKNAQVSYEENQAIISLDDQISSLSDVKEAIGRTGYQIESISQ